MKSPDGLTRREILIILLVAQKSFIRLYGVMENGICQWNHIQEINIRWDVLDGVLLCLPMLFKIYIICRLIHHSYSWKMLPLLGYYVKK